MAGNLHHSPPVAGWIGFCLGAAALMLVLVHFWIGPLAPQHSTGVTIGGIAAEMRQAATDAIKGKPRPEAVATPWDTDRVLRALAAGLAGLGVVAGLAALVRRENWRPAAAAIAMAGGAILFQVFTWIILVVAGVLILTAIIGSLDGFFGG